MAEYPEAILNQIMLSTEFLDALFEECDCEVIGLVNETEAGIMLSIAAACGVKVCTDDNAHIFFDDGKPETVAQQVHLEDIVAFCITYLEASKNSLSKCDPASAMADEMIVDYQLCIMQRLSERMSA